MSTLKDLRLLLIIWLIAALPVACVAAFKMTGPKVVTNQFDLPCDQNPKTCVGGYVMIGRGYTFADIPSNIQKVVYENPINDPSLVTPKEVSLTVMDGGMFVFGPDADSHELWIRHWANNPNSSWHYASS